MDLEVKWSGLVRLHMHPDTEVYNTVGSLCSLSSSSRIRSLGSRRRYCCPFTDRLDHAMYSTVPRVHRGLEKVVNGMQHEVKLKASLSSVQFD